MHSDAPTVAAVHPLTVPMGVRLRFAQTIRGALHLDLVWAMPSGPGPFPAVLVHGGAGSSAADMQPVLVDLASEGFVAMAVDYRRFVDGRYSRLPFSWRRPEDGLAALRLLRAGQRVDRTRIAALGFSRGGSQSLTIAAETDRLRAVVAYYPVTDLASFIASPDGSRLRRFLIRGLEQALRREIGLADRAEVERFLRPFSPLERAADIEAPVRLVHGVEDLVVGIDQSRRLGRRLEELGRPVELVEVPAAGHRFNFEDLDAGRSTWTGTLAFLRRALGVSPSSAASAAPTAAQGSDIDEPPLMETSR
ncbi:MAG: prolyl oligopeptidase family serine peptidase [Acidobacteriota bacterium]